MLTLESHRLMLRPLTNADAATLLSYRSDAVTNQYQGWIPKNLDDVHGFIERLAKQPNIPDTWFQLMIIRKADGKVLGDAGIHFMEDGQQAELGCTLRKEVQGQGYATEAMKCLLDYVFIDLEKHRVHCSVDPDNVGSIRLLNRLGLRQEAHFRQSLYLNGRWVDDLIFAMLRTEWKRRKEQQVEH